jgi:hypothetical protein
MRERSHQLVNGYPEYINFEKHNSKRIKNPINKWENESKQ